jgi:hypothetical protein
LSDAKSAVIGYWLLQAISKKDQTPNYGIASLFKMLTYSHVCCAFSSAHALSLNVICIFEMACTDAGRWILDDGIKDYPGSIIQDPASNLFWVPACPPSVTGQACPD